MTHSGLAEPNLVSVHVTSFDGAVTGEVAENGRGMGVFPTRGEGSLGLRIVERAVFRWGHSDHPTRVWFEFRNAEEGPSRRPAA